MQVPIVVICELLGVPYEDSAFFAERSEKAIGDSTYEEAAQAGADLKEYVIELVSRREREPDGGLISRIISQHVKPGNMTTQELIDTVRLLIIAGFETTMNQLGLSTLVLLCNPEVLAEVRDSEDEDVVNNAVEELLRYLSIVHQGRRRVAVRDVEIGGQLIRAGEPIIVAANTGDRDPSVFPHPDVVDIHRPNAKAHVAFGYGIHQCLGQHLSRMELRYAIPALLRRFPTLRLAVPFDQLKFKEAYTVYGVAELPVEW
jgi:cytochrome P450